MSPAIAELSRLLAQLAGFSSGPAPAPEAWGPLLELAAENALLPFLGSRAAALPAAPDSVRETLAAAAFRAGHRALFRTFEQLRTLTRLDDLEPIALKGAALALSLYSHAAEREMSDLDLLIADPVRRSQARARLVADGYQGSEDGASMHHHDPALHDPIAEATIELHSNLNSPPLPEGVIEEMTRARREIAVGGVRVRVLDPVDALIHHAIHALADPIDSPLLRNLFEVAWLGARLEAPERSELEARVRRWDLEASVSPAMWLAHDLFATTPPPFARPKPSEDTRWAVRRLGWTDSAKEERPLARRIMRARAYEHFGARRDSAKAILLSRLKGRTLARAKLDTAPIPEGLLAHDPIGGNVHVLDAVGRAVWEAASAGGSAKEIVEAAGAASGIDRSQLRAAVAALVSSGLLVRG